MINQLKKKRTIWLLGIAAAAVVTAGAMGRNHSRNLEEIQTEAETAVPVPEQPELPVSAEEEALLSRLYRAMEQEQFEDAAHILNDSEEAFSALLTESLEQELYCYWEETFEMGDEADTETVIRYLEPLTDGEAMEGMVLMRFNTVFYGSFSNGMPNGTCQAIQAMVLDEPRYTFADGQWENGRLNGPAMTGYHYYDSLPETGFIHTEKEGMYTDNLLEGEFVYRAENRDGEKLSWKMQADRGLTVLTDAWVHYPMRKEYMLGAQEDPTRAYVLAEDQAEAVLWNNLLMWDEK